ncbi:MAG: hypothetical protein NC453_20535 [Muribaculum sp.]|nr:hypothetical protein [Muribaculum sp.]
MNISTNFDFGDNELCAPSQIKITIKLDVTLGDVWEIPDIREVLAHAIVPVLENFKMSNRSITHYQEIIRLSGKLFSQVDYPYQYDVRNHNIIDQRDRSKKYPISDWLEGKLPD